MLAELIEHIQTDGIPYAVSCCQPLALKGQFQRTKIQKSVFSVKGCWGDNIKSD